MADELDPYREKAPVDLDPPNAFSRLIGRLMIGFGLIGIAGVVGWLIYRTTTPDGRIAVPNRLLLGSIVSTVSGLLFVIAGDRMSELFEDGRDLFKFRWYEWLLLLAVFTGGMGAYYGIVYGLHQYDRRIVDSIFE